MGQGCCSKLPVPIARDDVRANRSRLASAQQVSQPGNRGRGQSSVWSQTDDELVNEIINCWHSAEILYLQVSKGVSYKKLTIRLFFSFFFFDLCFAT